MVNKNFHQLIKETKLLDENPITYKEGETFNIQDIEQIKVNKETLQTDFIPDKKEKQSNFEEKKKQETKLKLKKKKKKKNKKMKLKKNQKMRLKKNQKMKLKLKKKYKKKKLKMNQKLKLKKKQRIKLRKRKIDIKSIKRRRVRYLKFPKQIHIRIYSISKKSLICDFKTILYLE